VETIIIYTILTFYINSITNNKKLKNQIMKKILFYSLIVLIAISCEQEKNALNPEAVNEQPSNKCLSDDMMAQYYADNPLAKAQMESFDVFTQNRVKTISRSKLLANSYIMPVVFHIYGTDFAGKTVNDQTIIAALQKVNEDFHGQNTDYGTVDPFFQSIRSAFDVTFKLAQRDPNGNPTTGIIYHPYAEGFGGTKPTALKAIKADAWDNYKYCNVYIQLDLYGDNKLNNSGVAWYPDKSMSDSKIARIVYNGRYLYGNTDPEFSSTLSHEFGHWLNLIHSFQDGCSIANENLCATTGDKVCDTPQATSSDNCSTQTNCAAKRVNVENYMGYAGAGGCYKMFSIGQAARMDAAMQHVARQTIWQSPNLTSTGVQ